MKHPFHPALALSLALCLLVSAPAAALFAPAQNVPVDRLIENIGAFVEENPEDAEAHYLLGRVNYLAFVNRSATVSCDNPGSETELPRVRDNRMQYGDRDNPQIEDEAAAVYARQAIESFNTAVALDEGNAQYRLGLAGLYEQAVPLATQIIPSLEDEEDDAVRQRCLSLAVAYNLQAYTLGRDAMLEADSVFLPFYPVAYEAGKAYARLVAEHELEPADGEVLDQIEEDIAAVDKLPMAITPIVMRVEGESPTALDELIAPGTTVHFDLDADGQAEERPWVHPDTAILVWDPEGTGQITSGRQLFGNMTFFMLFSDGYQAMDSLDDNRDGKLAGDELAGLALWHDRNSNGVSDAGEVTPISETAIRSIATTQTGVVNGIHPMNTAGVTLEDGSTRPTWDWIIPAVPQSEAGSGEAGR